MKAIQFKAFGGPEVLEIVELNDPHPGPGQVRIAVRAAGVNASDRKKRQGHLDQQLPQTLGYEAAGIVDELGEGVTDVAVNDRVFGFCTDGAAQAELAVLAYYAQIPPALGFDEIKTHRKVALLEYVQKHIHGKDINIHLPIIAWLMEKFGLSKKLAQCSMHYLIQKGNTLGSKKFIHNLGKIHRITRRK